MLRKYIKQRINYFIAFAIAFISVLIMLVAMFFNELTTFGDDTIKCGAFKGAGVSYSDCSLDGCKKTSIAGILWIVFACLGIICCFISPALLRVKKSLSFIPYIFAAIFYLSSIIVWVADNPICFAKNPKPSIGVSLILAIVAFFLVLIALIIAAYPKYKSSRK